jgi:hypothetical protein
MKFSTALVGNASAYIRKEILAYFPGVGVVRSTQLEPLAMYQWSFDPLELTCCGFAGVKTGGFPAEAVPVSASNATVAANAASVRSLMTYP